MDDVGKVQPTGKVDMGAQSGRDADGDQADPTSAAIIGTNLEGMNTATFPGGIAAPASELGEDEARSVDEGNDTVDLDALDRFGSRRRETGDQGVSPVQKDIESDELNS